MPNKKQRNLALRLPESQSDFLKFLQKKKSDLLHFEYDDADDDDDVTDNNENDVADNDEDEAITDDDDKDDSEFVSSSSDKETVTSDKKERNDVEDSSDEDKMNLDEEEISFEDSEDEMETELSMRSEEEEEEQDSSKKKSRKVTGELVTKNMVEAWVQLLRADSIDGLKELIEAFKAALIQTGNAHEVHSKYILKGSAVFNAVVNACMVELLPMILRVLHLPQSKDPNKVTLPSAKNKTWSKIKGVVGEYLAALLQFLTGVASLELKETVIKHLHHLIVFCSCFPKLSKKAMEKMISLWSTEEETIRVVALGCIIRLILHVPPKLVEASLKQMYSEYCKNCKFTTVQTLPLISYMKNSLVEIMALKPGLAYKCGFVAVQGLAKKLRSLSYGHKKEKKGKGNEGKRSGKKGKKEKQDNIPAVYNWPYLHSLSLWMAVACQLKSDKQMHQLTQALVNIVVGTIRVSPSVQYYPLRFTCLQMLIQLSEATAAMTFIPVLPFVTEVLDYPALNKFAKQGSMKSCNFDTCLRMSKNEVHEKVFLDGLIDQVFELVLHYCACFSHTVAFPELILRTVLQLKKFVKTSRVPVYQKKIKILLQKLEEHSDLIKKKRNAAKFNLQDIAAVESWERHVKEEKSPLTTFFETWKKKQLEKKALLYADKEKIEKTNEIKWKEREPKRATAEERERFPDLFQSYDSDEEHSSSDFASDNDDNSVDEEESVDEESDDEDDDSID